MKKIYLIVSILMLFEVSNASIAENLPKAAASSENAITLPAGDSCDLIILTSGETINAKILEVGTDEVRYKKCGKGDSPVYTIKKSEIFMIKYANGTQDVFNKATTNSTTQEPKKGVLSYKKGLFSNQYFIDKIQTTRANFVKYLKKNPFAKNLLNQSNFLYVVAGIFDGLGLLLLFTNSTAGLIVGIVFIVVGIVFELLGDSAFEKAVKRYNNDLNENKK